MQPFRCSRITMRQKGMYAHISTPPCNLLHRTAERCVRARFVKMIPFDKCLDIQPRPANDERQPPLSRMRAHKSVHACHKLRHGEGRLCSQHIHEMMCDARPFLSCRLRAADVKAAIEAHGVARDDVRPQFLCKLQRKLRLSDRRWSDENEQRAF